MFTYVLSPWVERGLLVGLVSLSSLGMASSPSISAVKDAQSFTTSRHDIRTPINAIALHVKMQVSHEFIFGLALASFFAFASSFFFLLAAATFSSFLRLRLAFSSSVFSRGLKKPSNLDCWLDLRFF